MTARITPCVLLLVALLLTMPGVGSVAFAQEPSPPFDPDQVPVPAQPVSARAGADSYAANCAPCHGAEGMGDGPTAASLPSPATAFGDLAAVWELSPAQLFHTTKFGRIENLMPPWGERLSDDEIWQTVAYAWSLHTSESMVEDGLALYVAECAACHGDTGAGDGPEATDPVPNMADPVYAMAFSQADWDVGWETAHPELGAEWSQGERESVLEAIRSFSYRAPWVSAYQPGSGVIVGRVAQPGDGGDTMLGGEQVNLIAYVDFEPVAEFASVTDEDGAFRFENLAVDPSVVYFVSTASDGVRYSSPILRLTADAPETETQVTVYQTTSDDSGISVQQMHLIIEPFAGYLVVGQIMTLSNSRSESFVGQTVDGSDMPLTVDIEIPDGAQEVSFENGSLGDRFYELNGKFYDTSPVLPGEGTRQIVAQYALPYDGTSVEFDQVLAYPVENFNVLVGQLEDMTVDISGLTLASTENFEGMLYQIWGATDLDADTISVSMGGLLREGDIDPRAMQQSMDPSLAGSAPVQAATMQTMPDWLPFVVGIPLALLVILSIVLVIRRRESEEGTEAAIGLTRNDLLQRIAQLDDMHALGELTDQAWETQRAKLKAQLLVLADSQP